MTIPVESRPEILRDAPLGNLTNTEEALFKILSFNEGRLVTWEEISQRIWGIPSDPSLRESFRVILSHLRPKLSGGHLYVIKEGGGSPGCFFSSENLEDTEVTLQKLGVSLFLPAEDRGAVIPGFSILSPEFERKPLFEPARVLRLMDKLVFVAVRKREPYFRPYLTRPERRILASLSQGGFHSKRELTETTKTFSPKTPLETQLVYLRKKLATEGLEIFSYHGIGWLLAQRPAPEQPFLYQLGPEEQADPLKSINLIHAHPGETRFHSPYLEPYSQQLATELLNFVFKKENLGRCLSFREVWQAIHRSDFYQQEEINQNRLRVQLFAARKILKGAVPDENWHIATIFGHGKLLLLQGKASDEVKLPALYDFSGINPEVKTKLAQIMENGVLKPNSTISPVFSLREAAILLKLAKSWGTYVSEAGLLQLLGNSLDSVATDPYTYIFRLRSRFKERGIRMTIENKRGLGYTLLLETS